MIIMMLMMMVINAQKFYCQKIKFDKIYIYYLKKTYLHNYFITHTSITITIYHRYNTSVELYLNSDGATAAFAKLI
jgi:hypothetical protein